MPTHTTHSSPEAEQIRNIERSRLRALVAGDMDAARPLHAPEFQLITPIGMPLSKDEYLGAIVSGQIKYLMWEPGPIAVRQQNGHAVIRYRARLEIVFGGHRVAPGDYWHTDTYEYRDGRWMVVWSQATAISQMS
ncbi:nuclear transport factor 2 family protein [Bradyrhizobium liaoningense]|uniref:nuclear transport factor 2 family protein n=1 Tax=Bradyrhizobium liaoningense TaxID=43992 RepID=UPI001BAB2695|nr:nuclear transport factor 2 family protein [Bradyrhizobium liaoningense]MBR0717376.1 nuclear transport factor 2 family protein [Bradyrhizobium liaoningense]